MEIWNSLAAIAGSDIDDRGWHQAKLGIKTGGLGLRSPEEHAAAAFLSSTSQTAELCMAIDPNFDPLDAGNHLRLHETKNDFWRRIHPDATVSFPQKQKKLSELVDAGSKDTLNHRRDADVSYRAHLSLQSLRGAGAWLIAAPTDDELSIASPLFQISLQRRLRLRVQDADCYCPLCGLTMDSFGDHALVCACNGDRTIRHNCLRNVVYEEAVAGGMSPTKEKAGLLPSRPPQDGVHTETTRSNRARRRPADVYLPRGPGNKPAALDFACTSGLRFDRLRAAIDEPDGVCADYEDMKRNFRPDNEDRGTEELCEQQGFQFLPMVIEPHS